VIDRVRAVWSISGLGVTAPVSRIYSLPVTGLGDRADQGFRLSSATKAGVFEVVVTQLVTQSDSGSAPPYRAPVLWF
jgi:hypothetical protein